MPWDSSAIPGSFHLEEPYKETHILACYHRKICLVMSSARNCRETRLQLLLDQYADSKRHRQAMIREAEENPGGCGFRTSKQELEASILHDDLFLQDLLEDAKIIDSLGWALGQCSHINDCIAPGEMSAILKRGSWRTCFFASCLRSSSQIPAHCQSLYPSWYILADFTTCWELIWCCAFIVQWEPKVSSPVQ